MPKVTIEEVKEKEKQYRGDVLPHDYPALLIEEAKSDIANHHPRELKLKI